MTNLPLNRKLKHKYGQLTNDDVGFTEGKEDESCSAAVKRTSVEPKKSLERKSKGWKRPEGLPEMHPEIESTSGTGPIRRRTGREIAARILLSFVFLVPMLLVIFLWKSCA